MTRFAELLKLLTTEGVDFIVVGGVAAAAHGSVRVATRQTPPPKSDAGAG